MSVLSQILGPNNALSGKAVWRPLSCALWILALPACNQMSVRVANSKVLARQAATKTTETTIGPQDFLIGGVAEISNQKVVKISWPDVSDAKGFVVVISKLNDCSMRRARCGNRWRLRE